jgi:hypothetical protein
VRVPTKVASVTRQFGDSPFSFKFLYTPSVYNGRHGGSSDRFSTVPHHSLKVGGPHQSENSQVDIQGLQHVHTTNQQF